MRGHMRDNFERSLSLVLRHEGGWADHPRDPGGATMKGITLATYRAWLGRNVTKAELRGISDEAVASIYRANYWNPVNGDNLPAGLDYAVFDYGVNSGPARAAKALQKIVGTTADGIIGPATLTAIVRHGVQNAILDLCDQRLAWLKRLKTWPTFGRGWQRRVTEVERDALAMRGPMAPSPVPSRTYQIPPFLPPADWEPPTPREEPAPSEGLFAALLRLLRRLFGGRP